MLKYIIEYTKEDFEGAKMLILQNSSFYGYKFTVVEVEKVTASNVIFKGSNKDGVYGTRKALRFFGELDFYHSYFLVRKHQTVEEAIQEVVTAFERHIEESITVLNKELSEVHNAQLGYEE